MVTMDDEELRHIRWQNYSVVMQSAMNALNPVMTIGAQLSDAISAHQRHASAEVQARSEEVMRLVGIDPMHLKSYPHQLSGGMRQRSMIAMALVFTPELVIMDEPTSALDVVAQRSLMLQIKELQRKIGFAAIFVTHDMSLVSHFSDRLAVMYAGQVMEIGPTEHGFRTTEAPLLVGSSELVPLDQRRPRCRCRESPAAPPDLARPPSGCRFHPRCPQVMAHCRTIEPRFYEREGVHVRCHPVRRWRLSWRPPSRPDVGGDGGTDHRDHRAHPALSHRRTALTPFPARGRRRRSGDPARTRSSRWSARAAAARAPIARLLARVYKPTRGDILYHGRSLAAMTIAEQRLDYAARVPMVFQDPYGSLSPVYRVSHGVMRALKLHRPELAAQPREGGGRADPRIGRSLSRRASSWTSTRTS